MAKIKFSFILKLIFIGCVLAGLSAMVVMKMVFKMSTLTMPDFTGIPIENAASVAERMGLELKIEDRIHSNVYKEGHVMSQSARPKTQIKKGRVIHVVVSKGSKMITVPGIIGMPISRAMLILRNADLIEGYKSEVFSNIYKEDTVIAQSPPPGENVPFNHNINILKSSGPGLIDFMMPGLKGRNISEIYSILKQHNLFIEDLQIENNEELDSGTILEQNPPAGYMVNEKIPISFTASKKPSDSSLKQRLIRIYHTFTGYKAAKLVKVSVFSLNGSSIVYNEITQPGETISASAKVRGDALVQIFVGTTLIKELEYKGPSSPSTDNNDEEF